MMRNLISSCNPQLPNTRGFNSIPFSSIVTASPKTMPAAGLAIQRLHRGADRARQVKIVRVQPGNDLAPGALQPFIEGIGLARVRLGDPPGKLVGVFTDNIQAAIRGAAIDDDVLQGRGILRQDRLDGLLKVEGLVKGWGYDRDQRHVKPGLVRGICLCRAYCLGCSKS